MTGGPDLSATATEKRRGAGRRGGGGLLLGCCWAAAGPKERQRASEAGKSKGLQRTSADGPRSLGWASNKERPGDFSRLLNFERFKLKIKQFNSNANLNSSNQK